MDALQKAITPTIWRRLLLVKCRHFNNSAVPVMLRVKVISQQCEQGMGVQLLSFSKSNGIIPEHAVRLEAQNGKSGLRQPSLAEPTKLPADLAWPSGWRQPWRSKFDSLCNGYWSD